jgi:hypothetical protein
MCDNSHAPSRTVPLKHHDRSMSMAEWLTEMLLFLLPLLLLLLLLLPQWPHGPAAEQHTALTPAGSSKSERGVEAAALYGAAVHAAGSRAGHRISSSSAGLRIHDRCGSSRFCIPNTLVGFCSQGRV